MKIVFFYIVFSSLLLFASAAFGQKKSLEIGGKIINEITFYNGYTPGCGIQVLYRIGKHGGIESGVYYKIRILNSSSLQTITGYYASAEIIEKNIVIPFLFRFDSKTINFTIGPAVEFFLGWKIKKSDISDLSNYRAITPELISTASISKNFNLNNKWIFEPEIRFSAFVPNGDGGWGLNLSLRKKIF